VKDLDVLLDHGILVGLELAPGAYALQYNKALPSTITYDIVAGLYVDVPKSY
jgi:hypothetical protein